MFSLCAELPEIAESDLYHLCASLNAPVVDLDGLPVGPVRAAIVLHAQRGDGGSRVPHLSVGFRLLESGSVAVYRYSGDVRELCSASRAMDAALCFAEAIGFLFDEDLVGGRIGTGQATALALWKKLVGADELGWDREAGFDGTLDAGDLASPTAELELDEPASAANRASAPAAESLEDPPGPLAQLPVSGAKAQGPDARDSGLRTRATDEKDRARAGAPAPAAGGPSTLGRVPIVRMRVRADGVPAAAGDGNRNRRLRLLGSF